MKNWIDYLENEEGKTVISTDNGLIAYVITGDELFVTDLYVKPEHRKTLEAAILAENIIEVAVRNGCKNISGNVYINKKNAEYFGYKIRVFTKFGFLPIGAQNNTVTMFKEL